MSHKIVKILVCGQLSLRYEPYLNKKKEFIMVFNLEKQKIEKLKVLNL